MIRATTPKHSFIFDISPEESFEKILITYSQGGQIILEKNKEDLEFEEVITCDGTIGYAAYCRLTQNETNLFLADEKNPVKIQVRVLTSAGEALASEERKLTVRDVLNDEVLE